MWTKKGLDIKSKPGYIKENLSFSGEKFTRGVQIKLK